MTRNVSHFIACRTPECRREGEKIDTMATVRQGIAYQTPDSVDPIRCETCQAAMNMVYTAIPIHGSRVMHSVRNDGLIATSTDGTTCEYGRQVVADAALQVFKPGEGGLITVEGNQMHVKRSSAGGSIDVTHVKRSDRGVKVDPDYGEA